MSRPLLLDLYCGAGGASMGYHRAGFDVVGVDIEPQPDYPFRFYCGNALDVVRLERFAVVTASPPCRDHSPLVSIHGEAGTGYLLAATRELLSRWGGPYVIENVENARRKMINPLMLCGTEFDLTVIDQDGDRRWVKRHRLFESNVPLRRKASCQCRARPIGGVYGRGGGAPRVRVIASGGSRGGYQLAAASARRALGVPWMNRDSAAQSIPPAYTEWLGRQLLRSLSS